MIQSPLFTFKHYAEIIKILRAMKPKSNGGSENWHIATMNEWQNIVIALADYFAKDNPKFKRELFIQECNR